MIARLESLSFALDLLLCNYNYNFFEIIVERIQSFVASGYTRDYENLRCETNPSPHRMISLPNENAKLEEFV